MEAEGILTALAEVSIAIAGFSGIVVALDRSDQPWSEADRARLWMLLHTSIACVFWSLFPILLHLAERPPESVWFWSSGAWLVYILFVLGYRFRQRQPLENIEARLVLAFLLVTVAIAIAVWLRFSGRRPIWRCC